MALASNLHGGRRVGDQEGVSLVTTIRPAEEGNGNEEGQGQGDPRPDANQPRHCVLASKAPVLALDLEPSHLARCPATPGADDRRSSHALGLGGAFFAFHLPHGVLTFALLGRLNGFAKLAQLPHKQLALWQTLVHVPGTCGLTTCLPG